MTAVAEPEHLVETEHKVTPLELFFDLVFVFALTQVTALMAEEPTWAGLAKGMLVFSALWWAWAAFSWLTNTVDAEEGATRAVMIAAMAAALVASLAVPGAFGSEALLFALAYTVLRLLHIVIYILQAPSAGRARGDRADGAGVRGVLRAADRGLGVRRLGAGRDLVRRADRARGRAVADRRARLDGLGLALRGAPWADHHHRARGVDRLDRRRRGGGSRSTAA